MIKKVNRIVKRKEIDTISDLWGDSISELHFRQDGTAWASNGEHATMIKYDPFTGEEMDYDNCPDYQLMPAYLIGEIIEQAEMHEETKALKVVLSGGETYEMCIDCNTTISIECDDLDKLIGKKIRDVSRDRKTSLMQGTIGSVQYVNFLVDDMTIHLSWVVPTSKKLNIFLKKS